MEFFIWITVLVVALPSALQTVLGQYDGDVLQRLAVLENAEKNNQCELQELRTTVENQQETINKLQKQLSIYKSIITPFTDHTVHGNLNKPRNNLVYNRRLLQESADIPKVGFTAYLSNGVTLASEQIVPFNKSVVNEGSGFNPTSGIFTCPADGDGVYLFTFVISAAGKSDSIGAMLVADGIDLVGALVETNYAGQDSQGGNQAIVQLKAGDQVWIRQSYGKYIASSEAFRGTSFTGVLLYK